MAINTRRRSSVNGLIVDIPSDTPNPNCPREMCQPSEEPEPPPPDEFTLTVSAEEGCPGSTVDVVINGGTPTTVPSDIDGGTPQNFTVEEGDTVQLTANTVTVTFLEWQDGSGAQLSTDNPYSFVIGTEDVTVVGVSSQCV